MANNSALQARHSATACQDDEDDDCDDDEDGDDLFLHRLCFCLQVFFCLEGFLMIDFLECSHFCPECQNKPNWFHVFCSNVSSPNHNLRETYRDPESLAPHPWPRQNWIQTKLRNSCDGAVRLDEQLGLPSDSSTFMYFPTFCKSRITPKKLQRICTESMHFQVVKKNTPKYL